MAVTVGFALVCTVAPIVDVVVCRRASLWGITALLTDWVTDMTHVMLFLAITCWAVGGSYTPLALPTDREVQGCGDAG